MVYYKFKNEEKAGLGIPLPAGNLRVYQKDSKGGVLFVGEDRIDHTPKDEFLNVKIGNAFDIVSERKQTDSRRSGSRTVGNGVRNHDAESQGHAHNRASERTNRRRLGDAVIELSSSTRRRRSRHDFKCR